MDTPSEQLGLFQAATSPAGAGVAAVGRSPAEPVCDGCGRPESEAPIYFQIERGSFCMDCEHIALEWPPPERPYAAGGPDHSRPWSNPALAAGQLFPSGRRRVARGGRA